MSRSIGITIPSCAEANTGAASESLRMVVPERSRTLASAKYGVSIFLAFIQDRTARRSVSSVAARPLAAEEGRANKGDAKRFVLRYDVFAHTITVTYESSTIREMNIEEGIALAGFAVNGRPANPRIKLPEGL